MPAQIAAPASLPEIFDMEINALAELERIGVAVRYDNDKNVKILCPFHADETASCSVEIDGKGFKCFTCGAKGDFINLLARILQVNRVTIINDLSTRYELEEEKLIDPQLIERYHKQLKVAPPLLAELYNRGLNDDDIREYRLGEREGRVVIPIKSKAGNFVNARLYSPGAAQNKVINLRGYGKKPRLYPTDQLRFPTLVLTGGECKAIPLRRELNPHDIGAVCSTGGETNWYPELVQEFAGKNVYLLLDIDKAGQKAALYQAQQIRTVAKWVGIVAIPLDIAKYPKGDISNWIADEKQLVKPLLDSCKEFVPSVVKNTWEANGHPAEEMDLVAAIHADQTAKRIEVTAVASMLDTAPYIIPKELEILCNRDDKACAACPVMQHDQQVWSLPPESPALLDFITSTKERHFPITREIIGIPNSCHSCSYQCNSYYNVDDVRLSPRLEITNRSSDNRQQPAYCIGGGMDLNESYRLTGRMFPHPKSQQAVLVISKYEQTQDSLSTYKCGEDIENLGVFWPREWTVESIQEKLDSIYEDFEANVTRIYQRRDVHLIVDLTYHSPLVFNFDGMQTKGWVESLIMGDTAQGKSEITCGSQSDGGLKKHYGLGEKVECKNASVAGLLGGLQESGKRWWVSWGIIPANDKRLVVLEELKGASVDVIGKLTDMRSSGIAEIPKIEKKKTRARTRLIALSNTRSGMELSRHNFGVQAIVELIGGLEDVRRFDVCLLVSAKDVSQIEINKLVSERPQVEHIHTSELCRSLVLWAWTRSVKQVQFTDEATAAVMKYATEMSNKFTSDIPIVDKGSMRMKLARLSAALAARLFSCDESFENLIIYPCHVEYIAKTLDRLYSSPTFGYLDYTKAIQLTQQLQDEDKVVDAISTTPYPSDLIKSLLATNKVDVQDFQDWCAYDRESSLQLLSIFVRKHCLIRDGRQYRKTAPFIFLLKDMLEKKNYSDCPEFIPSL